MDRRLMLVSLTLSSGFSLTAFSEPPSGVLGIEVGMTERRALRRLERLGQRAEVVEEPRGGLDGRGGLERQLWVLRDPRFAFLELFLDARDVVHALEVTLRPGGRGLRRAEIGNPADGRRVGAWDDCWEVPARNGRPGRRVTAVGDRSMRVRALRIVLTVSDEAAPDSSAS